MGHGIAQVAAMAGWETALYDLTPDLVDRGLGRIRTNLQRGVERGKVGAPAAEAALARLRGSTDLEGAAAGADLAVEAVPEDLELKRRVFARLGASCPAHALLATNTSSLPVGRIAEGCPRPERVCGMHFFNPVHILPLCEVVRASTTTDSTVERAVAAARAMGKTPIVVRDAPGFASSRLGVALGLEAIRMVEEGVASNEDIDSAMTLGYNHPMGPLRLTDLVGLDVRLAIAEHLARELDPVRFQPPALLRRMVEEGRLGKKTGQGFYRWEE
ncbi:MAG: 3-hydroxyacyl-CoA dehydrogenase family protein [Planctomycetes bacterium]|nr:3-hydroxyacyl-CoA dehydrogenase family protein [Planctomycetota bacterium]